MDERELLRRIITGSTQNVRFSDFVSLVRALGFEEARARGSHRIFRNGRIRKSLNLQPVRGEAKAYQIRQLVELVEEYDLRLEDGR